MKKGALLLVLAVVAALAAFMLPKRQLESRNPPTTQPQTGSSGYDHPTTQ